MVWPFRTSGGGIVVVTPFVGAGAGADEPPGRLLLGVGTFDGFGFPVGGTFVVPG
jgi:hypothetical protein